ncbi:hypothetical protein EV644_117133 [Kribbella orskensis]|uniref:Uncharacterized protein n=1 Tax=Kribbella orskensis TaxID=2512216 RepID=A0ABY2BCX1_9ACTN|nr:hypothetical protein EV642_118133 [Kribbella sp. VKM Ac-2500]TCO16479.1 hypothetical protein EV644_117133 [Kribbella orskensis]
MAALIERLAAGAEALDEPLGTDLDTDGRNDQRLQGSSSPAKKTVAALRIALSDSSRRTFAFSSLISANSSVVAP